MRAHKCRARRLSRLGRHTYRSLVDESAPSARSGDVGAMNRAVTVGAAIWQRKTGSVVVPEWHCKHNAGSLTFNKLVLGEPWALWQAMQFSVTGGC